MLLTCHILAKFNSLNVKHRCEEILVLSPYTSVDSRFFFPRPLDCVPTALDPHGTDHGELEGILDNNHGFT